MHTTETLVKESLELISLPDVYIRLRDVISSQNTSMSDVAQIIAHDPAITARLLKLVNSPFFGLAAKVDTMTRAINLLGTQQVHDLVLATVVVDSFSGFVNDALNIYDFWYNSVYCAVAARFIAYQCKNIDTERPFIAGLLHNIGHLLSYQILPDESRASAEFAADKNIELYLAEREIMGFDYAELGARLMQEWHMPESLQQITKFHTEPVKATDFRLETAIVHISSVLSQLVVTETPVSPDTLYVSPICWELTGLTVDDMSDIKKEVDQQASMVMSMLFTHTKSA